MASLCSTSLAPRSSRLVPKPTDTALPPQPRTRPPTSEPTQPVSDLFNTYRTIAPATVATWSFCNVLPLLRAELGGQTVDWMAAVVRPADVVQASAAAEAARFLLRVAVANWVMDAVLRKVIFWHKPIPWDFVVHHCVCIGLCAAVIYLDSFYGFMYLALLSESYAVVVFVSQLSFVKSKKNHHAVSNFERIKSVLMHLAGLAVLFLVRAPIWLFIVYHLITKHMREASDWMAAGVIAVCCVVIVALQYLDFMWSSYHIGELRVGRAGGIAAN